MNTIKNIKNISVPRFSRIFLKEVKMAIKSLYYFDEIEVNGKTIRRKQSRPTDFVCIEVEQVNNHTCLWIGDTICETAVVWSLEEIMEWLNTWMQGSDHKYTITYIENTKSIIVRVFAEPCKEFLMLNKYLKKHGGFTLGDWDYYHVVYTRDPAVEGEIKELSYRDYLCNYPRDCEAILNQLKSARKSKNYLSIEGIDLFKNGLYHKTFMIHVSTPTGIPKETIRAEDFF